MEQNVEPVPAIPTAKPQRPVDDAVLRTLSPALRALERSVRDWLGSHHRYPLSTIVRATLEGLATDLQRKADDLDVEKPLLVVLMMGGTGVGKSTLLNALAGGDEGIAHASFQRPTTRDPVVYYHESLQPDRFDPALRHCRLSPHDRDTLRHKIIVDTPDLDSNDLANREKLQRLLPVADVVLYVGSQEKYHDKLGWELFLQQRKRRAFAFILNKWDRCLHAGGTGLRPDEDLIRDLESEGFEQPLLFRTCAQQWVDFHKNGNGQQRPGSLPDGEQFAELMQWLELGLTRLEIEAIKARGVTQLLAALRGGLVNASPPDVTEAAAKTKESWQHVLKEEAEHVSEVLIQTLEPYQREIEHHFALQGQRRFRGVMSAYLNLFNKIRYFGSTLRDRIPLAPKARGDSAAPSTWDLGAFTRACSEVAANRTLDSRTKALSNRLLVEADKQGYPLNVLTDPVESTTQQDWRGQYSQVLVDCLQQVEQRWTEPQGSRRVVQNVMVQVANWAPFLAIGAAGFHLLWKMFLSRRLQRPPQRRAAARPGAFRRRGRLPRADRLAPADALVGDSRRVSRRARGALGVGARSNLRRNSGRRCRGAGARAQEDRRNSGRSVGSQCVAGATRASGNDHRPLRLSVTREIAADHPAAARPAHRHRRRNRRRRRRHAAIELTAWRRHFRREKVIHRVGNRSRAATHRHQQQQTYNQAHNSPHKESRRYSVSIKTKQEGRNHGSHGWHG